MLKTLHYEIDNEVARNLLGVNDRNLVILSELYGFEKQKRELMEKGYVFRSGSDCEIILPSS